MKRTIFFLLSLSTIFMILADNEQEAAINLQHKRPNDHIEHFVPFDQPDVFYNHFYQTIIIVGDGAVDYYDVEIAPVSTFVPEISTQENGFYDTIDVSSLSATEYYITISSPTGNEFEGFFEVQ